MLTSITCKSELALAYEILEDYEEALKEATTDSKRNQRINQIMRVKNVIRHNNIYTDYQANQEHNFKFQALLKGKTISFIEYGYEDKYTLLNEPLSKETIDEYYEEHQIYTTYDCSGLEFLSSCKQIPLKNGKYLFVEHWSLDI